jgi:20S proteasome alpha/beta subunit
MIYLLNSQANFAPQLFDNMPCMSGVPQYAVYLVHRYYDASMTSDQARALAEYLIAETESQDQKVGGPIKMAEITSKTGYRQLTDEEVKTIHETNEALNMKLRRFFLIGGD